MKNSEQANLRNIMTFIKEWKNLTNDLRKMEKDLRALAKRCKDVKYPKGLLLSFLFLGSLAF